MIYLKWMGDIRSHTKRYENSKSNMSMKNFQPLQNQIVLLSYIETEKLQIFFERKNKRDVFLKLNILFLSIIK